ncbi:hypothetical protein TNCT_348601 [Trichonephila clavata]|uniref:Uncharacterized protein n=1 Tax=Trichonephila clavata TaxID=2740835 RepID=A0A8X6GZ39_TRICU|nr:hypothetical protein TNCT_348601 [Trichonephila clavata]
MIRNFFFGDLFRKQHRVSQFELQQKLETKYIPTFYIIRLLHHLNFGTSVTVEEGSSGQLELTHSNEVHLQISPLSSFTISQGPHCVSVTITMRGQGKKSPKRIKLSKKPVLLEK